MINFQTETARASRFVMLLYNSKSTSLCSSVCLSEKAWWNINFSSPIQEKQMFINCQHCSCSNWVQGFLKAGIEGNEGLEVFNLQNKGCCQRLKSLYDQGIKVIVDAIFFYFFCKELHQTVPKHLLALKKYQNYCKIWV